MLDEMDQGGGRRAAWGEEVQRMAAACQRQVERAWQRAAEQRPWIQTCWQHDATPMSSMGQPSPDIFALQWVQGEVATVTTVAYFRCSVNGFHAREAYTMPAYSRSGSGEVHVRLPQI